MSNNGEMPHLKNTIYLQKLLLRSTACVAIINNNLIILGNRLSTLQLD